MSIHLSIDVATLYKYLPKIVRELHYPFNIDHATQQDK